MKIAFDQQVFLLQPDGGISRYVLSLAYALNMIQDCEARVCAPLHYSDRLLEGWRVPRVPKTARLVTAISEWLAARKMRRLRPDIVHETYYSNYYYRQPGAKRVLTVYDWIAPTHASYVAVRRADAIICISQATKRAMLAATLGAEGKVSVIYPGVDHGTFAPCQEARLPFPRDLYRVILFVGQRGGYKNWETFLRAFAASRPLREVYKVVCFGGGSFTAEEQALIDRIVLTGRVFQESGDDERLVRLYHMATILVYPSKAEGFGLLILEAMGCGCPVVCSDIPVLREVAGRAAAYCFPDEQVSIQRAMERVVNDKSYRQELIAQGYYQVKQFSWHRCAAETAEAYRKVLA